jgi:uncharacterized membrane protein YgdD (TMEM256/DUF423 family)
MLNQRQTLTAGAIVGMLSVAVGAFGAHALKPALALNGTLETYELAVRYQFYHTFALLIIGLLMDKFNGKTLRYAASCMLIGIALFSGSLYALAFEIRGIAVFMTPIGGVFFIAGWLLLFVAVAKGK